MIMEGVSDAMLKGEWIKGKWEELLFLVNLHWMGLFAEVGYHYLAVNQKIKSEESFTKAPLMWQWKDIFAENLIHKKLICYLCYDFSVKPVPALKSMYQFLNNKLL